MFDVGMLLPVWILGVPLLGGIVEAIRASRDANAMSPSRLTHGVARRPGAAVTAA